MIINIKKIKNKVKSATKPSILVQTHMFQMKKKNGKNGIKIIFYFKSTNQSQLTRAIGFRIIWLHLNKQFYHIYEL
jgi:hypothetical protein